MSTGWVADTHVHLYPDYDLGRLFRAAARNLRVLATRSEDRLALLLTERAGTHRFNELPRAEHEAFATIRVDGEVLRIFPGRQIATRERLEVLSLLSDEVIDDGGELGATVQKVRDAGGIPVLPWSPGKWRGERAATVRAVIEGAEPGALCVGDILMRPRRAAEPPAFAAAREKGHPVLAGTDPLPLLDEEDLVGRYGVRLEGETLRDALRSATLIGERQHRVQAGLRWARQWVRSNP